MVDETELEIDNVAVSKGDEEENDTDINGLYAGLDGAVYVDVD